MTSFPNFQKKRVPATWADPLAAELVAVRILRLVYSLDNVTLYSAKLRNPTQVATMKTALDLGVF